ncbi:MAG: hypothetical protein QXD98_00490 [Candidatus Diapherotrites archaeon]
MNYYALVNSYWYENSGLYIIILIFLVFAVFFIVGNITAQRKIKEYSQEGKINKSFFENFSKISGDIEYTYTNVIFLGLEKYFLLYLIDKEDDQPVVIAKTNITFKSDDANDSKEFFKLRLGFSWSEFNGTITAKILEGNIDATIERGIIRVKFNSKEIGIIDYQTKKFSTTDNLEGQIETPETNINELLTEKEQEEELFSIRRGTENIVDVDIYSRDDAIFKEGELTLTEEIKILALVKYLFEKSVYMKK